MTRDATEHLCHFPHLLAFIFSSRHGINFAVTPVMYAFRFHPQIVLTLGQMHNLQQVPAVL